MNQPTQSGIQESAWTTSVAQPTDGEAVAGPAGDVSPVMPRLHWWPVLVPVIIVLIGAWHYRWVDEDAFINFRVIDNLLAGHGLVFNVGERVEVDSDPLWLFTLVVMHGILPFLRLEWLSVVMGLLCTAGGFLAGGRAFQRLVCSRDQSSSPFPVGLLIVSVVAGVWEFSTSGLEMSMVFLWLGASYLLLVRVAERRRGSLTTAVVIGLGCLIRPELALMTIVYLAGLVWICTVAEAPGAPRRIRRGASLVLAAIALPVAFQIFRMGYYALVVPNTGLAKAGGSAWWSQGFTYLWNFVAPYTLWLPLALAAVLVARPVSRWWRRDDRIGVLLIAVPIVAGLLDTVYVVRLGGDYMHARLLLPAFFSVCLPIGVSLDRERWRLGAVLPTVGIAVWALVCAGWLRFVPPAVTSLNPQHVFISNERDSWVSATHQSHPVTASDYAKALSGQAGSALARMADQILPGQQWMLVITDPFAPLPTATRLPARSTLPFTLSVNVPAIGVIGYLAGPKAYLFDSYSLANPIGSHTTIVHHSRPGHEKFIGPAWMVARFGDHPMSQTNPGGAIGATNVAAARRALGCAPLSSYLRAITSTLTPSGFVSNFVHALGYTTMSFSADPERAAVQICVSSNGSVTASRSVR